MSTVNFVDLFDNIPGAGCEVLYVRTLNLGLGSVINLNDCIVYYETLFDGGATVNQNGGALVCINPGDINCDGTIDSSDVDALSAVLVGLDTDPAHVAAADLSGDGVRNGDDIHPFVEAFLSQ